MEYKNDGGGESDEVCKRLCNIKHLVDAVPILSQII